MKKETLKKMLNAYRLFRAAAGISRAAAIVRKASAAVSIVVVLLGLFSAVKAIPGR